MALEIANDIIEDEGQFLSKVFLSYSRKDMEKVEAIFEALHNQGFKVFRDLNDVLPAEEWRERLKQLIEASDSIVFLISPSSLISEECDWETTYAAELSKRIVPVVIESVSNNDIPLHIRKLNFVKFETPGSFKEALGALENALNTDIKWIREHTRLTELAQRWARSGRQHGLLRNKDEVLLAENWKHSKPREAPSVSELQDAFIFESRRALQQRKRRQLIWGTVLACVFISAATLAYLKREQAITEAKEKLRQESEFLAQASNELTFQGAVSDAIALAWHALPHDSERKERPFVQAAEDALRLAMTWNKEVRVFGEFGEGVNSIEFSPDGKLLATSSNENGVSIWQISNGAKIASLLEHEGEVYNATFRSDGEKLLTSGRDGTARIWSVKDWQELVILKGHERSVDHAEFSPSGDLVLTGSSDGTARIWDSGSGQLLWVLRGHSGWVSDIAFSPNGKLVGTGGIDKTARIWSVQDGSEVAVLSGHEHFVMDVEFSPDGNRFLTASSDGTVRLWGKDGKFIIALEGHTAGVTSAAFTTDGRLLTASEDHTVDVWFVGTGKAEGLGLGRRLGSLIGHKDRVQKVKSSPDGKHYFSSSSDGTIMIWSAGDFSPYSVLGRHEMTAPDFALSPDGDTLASGTVGGRARLWSAEFGNGTLDLEAPREGVTSFDYRSDMNIAVVGYSNGIVRIWDTASGKEILVFKGHWKEKFTTQSRRVTRIVLSPDGSIVASVSADGTLSVWQARDGRELLSFPSDYRVSDVKFLNDGTQVLVSSYSGFLSIWEIAEKFEAASLKLPIQFLSTIDVSPNQKLVLARDIRHPTAYLIHLDEFSEALPLRNLSDISCMAFSPDSKSVVFGSWSGMASIWDVAERRKVTELRGHTYPIKAVSFSHDGLEVITGSLDTTAKLWRVSDGVELATLGLNKGQLGGGSVVSVGFHPSGEFAVTGSMDGNVSLWRLTEEVPALVMNLTWDRTDVSILEARLSLDGNTVIARAEHIVEPEPFVRIWKIWGNYPELISEASEAIEKLNPLSATDICKYLKNNEEDCSE